MTIKTFNINQALNGASIGFISGDKAVQYIINFKYSNEKRADKEFIGVGQADSKKYYFNNEGICSDNLAEHKLYRIEDKISFTTGTVASRGETEGAEMITVSPFVRPITAIPIGDKSEIFLLSGSTSFEPTK